MAATKNLCAQVPIDLHQRVCEAKDQAGQTTSQYITALITEYFTLKENGGNETMTTGKPRTLAFQINEELFQRIKAHLERESARLGRNYTQREFVISLIEQALEEAEPDTPDSAKDAQDSPGTAPAGPDEAPEGPDGAEDEDQDGPEQKGA